MNILVTGSSGFIGTYLVDALREHGHKVVGVDREEPGWSEPDHFVRGDILEPDTLDRAFGGVECVLHLAAAKDDWGISRDEYFRDNVEATKRLLSVGLDRGVRKWFHYSTVGVLAPGPEPSDETAERAPTTDYGASKAEAEKLFEEVSRRHPDAEITMIRPSAVFGPRHPPVTNVHRLIEAIRADRFLMVGDGMTKKTTSYIENLIAATLFLLKRKEPGLQTYHYVDEPVMTTEELVQNLYELLSKRRPPWRVPLAVARPLAYVSDLAAALLDVNFPITAARIEKFCTSTNVASSAIRRLGFAQPVSNMDALARTVRWHQEGR